MKIVKQRFYKWLASGISAVVLMYYQEDIYNTLVLQRRAILKMSKDTDDRIFNTVLPSTQVLSVMNAFWGLS